MGKREILVPKEKINNREAGARRTFFITRGMGQAASVLSMGRKRGAAQDVESVLKEVFAAEEYERLRDSIRSKNLIASNMQPIATVEDLTSEEATMPEGSMAELPLDEVAAPASEEAIAAAAAEVAEAAAAAAVAAASAPAAAPATSEE